MNSLIAIIVTHNGSEYIEYCLNSLQGSERPPDRILVIDNASQDDTVQIVHSSFPSVDLIELEENIGFGPGNNIGLRYALNEGFDYVLLLNQDASLKPETIDRLLSAHERHSEYGILSPLHVYDEDRLDINFERYLTGVDPSLFSDTLLGKEMKEVYSIDFVNAAMWMISKECLRDVGGFDPLFEHYGEDNDFIYRLQYHGYKCGICPNACAYHRREQERTWPSYKYYIRTKDLIRLKNIQSRFYHANLAVLVLSIKRMLYFIKKLNGSKLKVSAVNLFVLLTLLQRIKKHRALNMQCAASFLEDDFTS